MRTSVVPTPLSPSVAERVSTAGETYQPFAPFGCAGFSEATVTGAVVSPAFGMTIEAGASTLPALSVDWNSTV